MQPSIRLHHGGTAILVEWDRVPGAVAFRIEYWQLADDPSATLAPRGEALVGAGATRMMRHSISGCPAGVRVLLRIVSLLADGSEGPASRPVVIRIGEEVYASAVDVVAALLARSGAVGAQPPLVARPPAVSSQPRAAAEHRRGGSNGRVSHGSSSTRERSFGSSASAAARSGQSAARGAGGGWAADNGGAAVRRGTTGRLRADSERWAGPVAWASPGPEVFAKRDLFFVADDGDPRTSGSDEDDLSDGHYER
ncbi:hypothetical protein T492DRAFT_969380 [Pavlovales sp. CCMP2436]|nr:hypothetical protein T492DRAFT_969380 [Pavlovales sp. CCMP2436]|mmetsp:Transcript_11197/g.26213  ORF Transcript_11197/g.26213 Transcript_11197/m.26213 type:complete len:253 (+) Transcript_11197:93-851(+)